MNSFDEDGDCVIDSLPWSTVSDLGVADENATPVDKDAFSDSVEIPQDVTAATAGHSVEYLRHGEVFMLYDVEDDIHYFFT